VERGYDLDIKNPNKKEDEVEHSSKELMKMLEESFGRSEGLLKAIRSAE
jgi:type I restriction enzyme M protein